MAWIEFDPGAPAHAGLTAQEFGRVMLKRFSVISDRDGAPIGLKDDSSNVVKLAASAGQGNATPGGPASANDNAVWVGDENGTGFGGVIGRDPQALLLVTGDTIVTWVGPDGALSGKVYPPADDADFLLTSGDTSAASDFGRLAELLQEIAPLAPDQRYRLVDSGRDGFAVLWSVAIAGGMVLQGRAFAPEANGDGGWSGHDVSPVALPASVRIETDVKVLGWTQDSGTVTVEIALDGDRPVIADTVALDGGAPVIPAGHDTAATHVQGSSTVQFLAQRAGAAAGDGADLDATGSSPTASAASSAAAQPAQTTASLHSGIVDMAGTGGQLLVGDEIIETDGVAGPSAGDVIVARGDDLTGTDGDDVIIGDRVDTAAVTSGAVAGGDDHLHGGRGDDVIYGGGGDDDIDGGGDGDGAGSASTDTAILTGDSRDYSITVNGDGTYTVVLARSDHGSDIDRAATGFEGVDLARGIEQYQFLNGDKDYVARIVDGADIAALATAGHGVIQGSDLFQLPASSSADGHDASDGTPTAWGLSRNADGTVDNRIEIADAAGNGHGSPGGAIAAATADGGFSVGWVADGALQVAHYDALGQSNGTPSAVSTDAIDTTVSPAMDRAGNGVTIAYVSTNADSHDAPAGIEVRVIGGDGDGSVSITPAGDVTSLAVAGGAGNHLTLAWIEQSDDDAGNHGDVIIQRLEVTGQGTAAGISISQAGLDGSANDGNDGPTVVGQGSAAAITDTDGDGFAVAWVADGDTSSGSGEQTQRIDGQIFSGDGVIVESFTLPLGQDGKLRDGTGPTLMTTGGGDLFVSWQEVEDDADGFALMSALLRQLGPHEWSQPIIRELRHFDDTASEVSVAIAGDDGDAIVVTWRNDGEGGGEIVGQRFSVDAIADAAEDVAIGVTFEVSSNATDASVIGLDDGRVVVVVQSTEQSTSGSGHDDEDSADAAPNVTITAAILDTREPDQLLIGAEQGSAQDTHVGTVGDDIIDGRGSQDALYGALGNDVLTGGTGDDDLDGGDDADTLLGGSGSDRLDGGDGDDLLMGGFGRDYIVGGDGIDTLSYRGETRAVSVDLATGVVRSDAAHNAVETQPDGLDIRGIDGDIFRDTGVEDLLGSIETTNRGSEGGIEFKATHDIENIEGGLGDDSLAGDGGDNRITGGKGNDLIDGRGGHDTAAFSGSMSDYDISRLVDGSIEVRHARNTSATSNDGTDTLRSIETVSFADGDFELRSDGTLSPASVAAAFNIASEISVAALEAFEFEDCVKGSTSGTSGPSGEEEKCDDWSSHDDDDDDGGLFGLGSDTLYFGDLDAIFDNSDRDSDAELFSDDGLDYGSCTVLASQAEIEAAMCLDGPDALDALTTCDDLNTTLTSYDPTEFRVI